LPISGIHSLINRQPTGAFGRTYYFFRNFYWRIPNYFNNLIDKFDYDNRYQGYLVFNKPKYKPGDTVKYKAFIVNKKGKPLNKELSTVLTNQHYSGNFYKTINTVKPYNKGAYTSEFILNDSLNLKLDKSYRVNLNKKNNKYKTAISGTFKYEDYELKSNTLKLETDKKIQYKGDDITISIKGSDENNLNLQDARYDLILKHTYVKDFFNDYVFVPDTLFRKKGNLKPSGKTEIIIPDSIFPAANFDYTIKVIMHTSDNERSEKSKNISYYHKKEEIKYKLIEDSIKIWYELNGIRNNVNTVIHFVNQLNNDSSIIAELPASFKIKPNCRIITVKSAGIYKRISLFNENSALKCYTFRNKDSLLINIENPHKLKFNFFLYKHNKEILSGYTDSLNYNIKHPGRKSYFLSLQYLWGGKIVNTNYNINYQNNTSLNVRLIQPKLVYPGQKSKIIISVTDENGKPANNTDLTAYSLTKKFHYNSPSLPVIEKKKKVKTKELINSFKFKNIRNQESVQKLNYLQWKKIAGLDSMEYYNFIYPEENIYITTFDTPRKKTQFAPYVLRKGSFQKIYVVYVDNSPVYFSWMTTQNPYSFKIDSGYHRIKLRLTDTLLVIDSLYFNNKQKTVFSLNKDFKSKIINTWNEKNKFSDYEQDYLKKHIFPYRYSFGHITNYNNTFKNSFSYIEQGKNIIPLRPTLFLSDNLSGPVDLFEKIHFKLLNGFDLDFYHEANFQYDFMPKILKMRSIKTENLFPLFLQNNNPISQTSGFILTKEDIENQYLDFKNAKRKTYNRYDNPDITINGNGTMNISAIRNNLKNKTVLNTVLLKLNNEKFVRVYPGNNKTYYNLEKGYYKLIFLMNDSSYFEKDSIFVKSNGDNYFRIKPQDFQKDSFSIYVYNLIDSTVTKVNTIYSQDYEKQKILDTYRSEHQYTGRDANTISGYVLDETGEPLPGVSILLKGTTYGTMTLADGFYSINAPVDSRTLVFSYIGMETQEQTINPNRINDAILMPSSECIEEVVVTALGISKGNKSIGYSVSNINNTLNGKVAGVNIATGASPNVILRGASSIDASQKPLIIFNGVPYTGDINKISPDLIKNIEVLKGKEAVSLYGIRAVNGALIITSKEGIQLNKAGKIVKMNNGNQFNNSFFNDVSKVSALRTNFSDYAFWQPMLKTDKNGTAEFEVTFPDDITSWDTHVLAMNGKRQSGKTKAVVKSYKPLAARLSLPLFLIMGDTTYAIGKSLNYLADSMKIKTEFTLNDKTVFERDTVCKTSVIDTLEIIAGTEDSLKVKYILRAKNSYFDGEQRKIPVFPVGLERTSGNFIVLDKDTTIKLDFNKQLGDVKLYAKTDAMDILGDEIGHLIYYMHNCNEQMASKLKAMLADEEISKFKDQKYRHKLEIKKLIRKLSRNQNNDGLWGWWGKSKSELWITNHIIGALLSAEKNGYKFKANKEKISDKLHYLLETGQNTAETAMTSLKVLKMLNAEINYKYYIEQIEKSYKGKTKSFITELKITELKQFCGLPFDTELLNKYKKTTFFGNVFF